MTWPLAYSFLPHLAALTDVFRGFCSCPVLSSALPTIALPRLACWYTGISWRAGLRTTQRCTGTMIGTSREKKQKTLIISLDEPHPGYSSLNCSIILFATMTLFFLPLLPILSSGCSPLVLTVLFQSTQAAQDGCHQPITHPRVQHPLSSTPWFSHSLALPWLHSSTD